MLMLLLYPQFALFHPLCFIREDSTQTGIYRKRKVKFQQMEKKEVIPWKRKQNTQRHGSTKTVQPKDGQSR